MMEACKPHTWPQQAQAMHTGWGTLKQRTQPCTPDAPEEVAGAHVCRMATRTGRTSST